jgi:hypothetical protein
MVTDESRKTVENAAGMGLPHEQIAFLIGVTDKTLRKKYRSELAGGKIKANLQIGATLFKKATGGDATCLIWWTKTQMGWREDRTLQLSTPPGRPLETTQTYVPGSPELLRDYYAKIAASTTAAPADPAAAVVVGPTGPGRDEPGDGEGFSPR